MTLVLTAEDAAALAARTRGSAAAQLKDAIGQTKRRHKYRANPIVVDGIRFDSEGEARRYGKLRMLERAGQVFELARQPSYPLHVCNVDTGELVIIGAYQPDFTYRDAGGRPVVEDYKGHAILKTRMYRWKKKHFEAEYGIRITETGAHV